MLAGRRSRSTHCWPTASATSSTLAIATFVIGFAVSFNGAVSAIVIGSLIIGSVLLAPAIVLGYAVKAAERDDRERGL